MATGSVSMLGLAMGGQTALNADLVDQLREADKAVMIKPLENQLTKVYTKQDDQAKLDTLLGAFSDNIYNLTSELTYMKRTVSVSHDSVAVSASDGVDLQNMSLTVNTLAKNSVAQIDKKFATDSAIVNNGSDALMLKIGRGSSTSTLDIEVKAGMTIAELRDAINNASGGKVVATILNTGGTDPYSLVVKSADTGAEEELSFTVEDSLGAPATSADLKFKSVQEAKDAEFEFNGMQITRASNKITDLVSGVTIELKKEDSIASNVGISRDLTQIGDMMQAFTDSYNELMTLLQEITKYDADSGERGSFQGDGRINSIRGEINRILSGNDNKGGIFGLAETFSNVLTGTIESKPVFDLSEKGVLTFKQDTFEKMLEQDPTGMEKMLRGMSETSAVEIAGTAVTTVASDKTYSPGDLIINGVAFGSEIAFKATNTAAQNAQALIEAINKKSGETGVLARIGASGDNIILYDKGGGPISVSGVNASEFGLQTATVEGVTTETQGIFAKLDSYVSSLNGLNSDSTISLVDQQLKKEVTLLTESIQKVLNRLTAKYDIMTAQFTSYNLMISRYESSFSSVQQLIDQASNAQAN